jgi:endonuclease/exonuclease/phosphatase family metal-dependent hydrolase
MFRKLFGKSDKERQNSNNHTSPISLFSLNCFLIPSFIPDKPGDSPCTNQHERATYIAQIAKKYDIVVLQEVWGTAIDNIEQQLVNTHQIPSSYLSWSYFGLGDYINTVRYYVLGNGGLYFAAKHDFPIIYHDGVTFTNSKTKSRKGVHVSVLDMDSRWKGRYLCIFYTHLDPFNDDDVQFKQLDEVKEFMLRTFETLLKDKVQSIENMSVLLVGDLNIYSGSDDYDRIFKIFGNIRDLNHEYTRANKLKEKGTFGKSRIDYILAIDKFSHNKLTVQFLPLKVSHADVMQNIKLSDHFPQEIKMYN